MPWVKRNTDVLFGLLAWAVALSNCALGSWESVEGKFVVGLVVTPTLWAICAVQAMKRRRRNAVYLLWIWLSVPAALDVWFLSVSMMIAVNHFAP
jgi:hypothetical protein